MRAATHARIIQSHEHPKTPGELWGVIYEPEFDDWEVEHSFTFPKDDDVSWSTLVDSGEDAAVIWAHEAAISGAVGVSGRGRHTEVDVEVTEKHLIVTGRDLGPILIFRVI